jgi:hypothetical protein
MDLTVGTRDLQAVTEERSRIEVDAVSRRGRTITCTTTILPLPAGAGDGALGAAIVLMEDGTVGSASRPAD